jgi:hypothetical protein
MKEAIVWTSILSVVAVPESGNLLASQAFAAAGVALQVTQSAR